jgi:hypothetical protein
VRHPQAALHHPKHLRRQQPLVVELPSQSSTSVSLISWSHVIVLSCIASVLMRCATRHGAGGSVLPVVPREPSQMFVARSDASLLGEVFHTRKRTI